MNSYSGSTDYRAMANKKQFHASLIIAGHLSSTLKSAFGSTQRNVQRIGAAVTTLSRQQRLLGQGIQTFGRMGRNIDGLRTRYDALTRQLERTRAAQQRLNQAQATLQAHRARLSQMRGQLGGAVGTLGAVSAAAFFPIKAAVEFETAMLGVVKQVDGARDNTGKLTSVYYDMGNAIQQLARTIPMATNELADMVTAGARMGIAEGMNPEQARKTLIEFTRVSAMAATAFEMPAGELADNMGKIAGIFKIPINTMERLGDAINYLDDNAISKGGDIIKVMQGDLAGAASTMGLSAKNAAALASTFLTLGESAERADTAASGMLRQLQIAKMNPKRFQIGVGMLGMTADQLQKGMVTDPQSMILDVLTRIKTLPVEQQMEAVTRLFGKDWGGAIAKLANGVDEYRRQLALANGEAAKGSMSREFKSWQDSTAGQWQLTKNRLSESAVRIGEALVPAVKELLTSVAPVIEQCSVWISKHPGVVKAVLGTALALAGVRVAVIALRFAFAALQYPLLLGLRLIASWRAVGTLASMVQVRTAALAVGRVLGRVVPAAFMVAGRAALWLGRLLLMNPLGLAVTAIASGALLIIQHWNTIKPFMTSLWEDVKKIFSGAWGVITGLFTGNFDRVKNGFKTMFDGIGTIATSFFDKLKSLWNWATEKFTTMKQWLGIGDSLNQHTIATAGAPPAATVRMPPLAQQHRTNNADYRSYATYNITQQPGERGETLARRIAAQSSQSQRQPRSALYDDVRGQE
ncbi:phage tail tape measure protein [Xylella fastidiosa subsp. multiplex]|nr:phage tail tape measure protein [Xylella fastidiosa]MDD0862005.1 phage tail tape measure protein [Xylella fastidiosa subsp. multiplex]MDD0886142.1 phage tail tape measure protein [Xylella fastidiosa subsp. multiplex]MDD0919171.1 phage tail tape measure protein [Xylella fastidiosa subsp. multiplex]MDD0939165.1 phage tail tape measure protein [Xylella fastidiosa subsp. multiplex]MDD0952776.1 phage tail tape measure protein [Xylella fastidiosa subsp. multiplex]